VRTAAGQFLELPRLVWRQITETLLQKLCGVKVSMRADQELPPAKYPECRMLASRESFAPVGKRFTSEATPHPFLRKPLARPR